MALYLVRNIKALASHGLTQELMKCLLLVLHVLLIHLKLEMLTKFPALNEKHIS